MMTTRWWLGLALLTVGCATTSAAPPTQQVASEPVAVEKPSAEAMACAAATEQTSGLMGDADSTGCTHDLDCQEVSALLAGRCGVFVNAKQFASRRAEYSSRIAACDALTQVVPRCPALQPVCLEERCQGQTVAAIDDECTERREALVAEAKKDNRCTTDTDCVLFETVPTSTHFVEENLEARGKLARACGSVSTQLFETEALEPEAYRVDSQCAAIKPSAGMVATIKGARPFERAELDSECMRKAVTGSFHNFNRVPDHWAFTVRLNVSAVGVLNQFDFIEPGNWPEATQRAVAWRLHQCTNNKPMRVRGKPKASRWRIQFIFD